jgi:hypothetical protein
MRKIRDGARLGSNSSSYKESIVVRVGARPVEQSPPILAIWVERARGAVANFFATRNRMRYHKL